MSELFENIAIHIRNARGELYLLRCTQCGEIGVDESEDRKYIRCHHCHSIIAERDVATETFRDFEVPLH